MKRLFFLMSIVCVMSLSASWEYLSKSTFDRARAEHKPVALFIYKPTCQYCTHFMQNTLNDSNILALLKGNFITAVIDATKHTPPVAYSITPSLAILDSESRQLTDTTEGDVPPSMLIPFLRQVVSVLQGRLIR
jgi:thioredoxin-related protein